MEKFIFRFPARLQRGAYAWLKRRSMIFLDGPWFVCFQQFTDGDMGRSVLSSHPFHETDMSVTNCTHRKDCSKGEEHWPFPCKGGPIPLGDAAEESRFSSMPRETSWFIMPATCRPRPGNFDYARGALLKCEI